jgi:hypothetical protein
MPWRDASLGLRAELITRKRLVRRTLLMRKLIFSDFQLINFNWFYRSKISPPTSKVHLSATHDGTEVGRNNAVVQLLYLNNIINH